MESHIVLTPEILGYMGSLPVSNTLLVSWMVMGFLLIISVLATKNVQLVPTGLQNLVELVIEGIYNTVSELAQEKTKVIFPVVATFFLFILQCSQYTIFKKWINTI